MTTKMFLNVPLLLWISILVSLAVGIPWSLHTSPAEFLRTMIVIAIAVVVTLVLGAFGKFERRK